VRDLQHAVLALVHVAHGPLPNATSNSGRNSNLSFRQARSHVVTLVQVDHVRFISRRETLLTGWLADEFLALIFCQPEPNDDLMQRGIEHALDSYASLVGDGLGFSKPN